MISRETLRFLFAFAIVYGFAYYLSTIVIDYAKEKNLETEYPVTVKLYVVDGCSYCTKAKSLLSENNITFKAIKIRTTDLREKLAEHTGQNTVPYVFIDNKFIGGFTELAKENESGALQTLESANRIKWQEQK